MKINEYIKAAVSKIFNPKEKQKVEAELSDHMLLQKAFNEEIGYNEQTAEEMAVEVMGNSEDISESLALLHNDYYNPIWDIVRTIIWLFFLSMGYYLLQQYIFDDIGAVAISTASIFTAITLFFISSFITMNKSRTATCIFNAIGGIGTVIFTYFTADNISKFADNSSDLIKILAGSYIPSINTANNNITILFSVAAAILVILMTAISLSYCIKKENLNNTLSDNRLNRITSKTSIVLSVVFIAAAILYLISFFSFQNNIKEKYCEAFELALDISENCETIADVNEYIKSSPADFTETKNNNTTIGYIYNSEIASIIISFNPDEDENKTNSAAALLIKTFANAILKQFPESYEQQNEYSINFSISNLNQYKNGYDSISLLKIKTTPKQIDEIHNFIAFNQNSNDKQKEYLKNYLPANLYILPSNNQYKHDTQLTYTYTVGSGTNTYNTDFFVFDYSEKRKDIEASKEKAVEFFKKNPDADNSEIVKNLDCTLDKKQIDEIGSMLSTLRLASGYTLPSFIYDAIEEDELSNQFRIFKFSDDLSFIYSTIEAQNMIFFFSYTNISFLDICSAENAEEGYFQSISSGMWRKIAKRPDIIYYSKKGIAYANTEDIPYYTKNGQRFRYELNEDELQDRHYLIGPNGETHEANHGYIDKDGYLHFFSENELKKNGPKEYYYHDSKGNIYTKALETSWDEEGNILNFEDYDR